MRPGSERRHTGIAACCLLPALNPQHLGCNACPLPASALHPSHPLQTSSHEHTPSTSPLLQLPNTFEKLPFLFHGRILPPSQLPQAPQVTEAELQGEQQLAALIRAS